MDRLQLLDRLRLLLRSEQGFALPTAIFAMVASLGLAGAAVFSSVQVQEGSKRDSASKRAIAAADAGADVATMRLSEHAAGLSSAEPCLQEVGGVLTPSSQVGANGWCPPVEEELAEDGGTYRYWMSPAGSECGEYQLCLVVAGTVAGVSRRVEVVFSGEKGETCTDCPVPTFVPFGGEGLIGKDGISLSGNSDIQVGVGTNGQLTTSGNTTICGDIRVGVGKQWVKSGNASQCSNRQFKQENRTLPSVESFMPSDIATNNSNWRLERCTQTTPTKVPAGCQSDTFSGSWSSSTPWNSTTRTISASGNTTLTLGGGDYWICRISFSGNSQLIMAQGALVRIFFDTPEKCGSSSQISLSGNNKITATGYQPSKGDFDMPGFYLTGSTSITTSLSFSGNTSSFNEFVVYAPNTHINLSGNVTKGAVIGKTLSISGNTKIVQDKGFVLPASFDPTAPAAGEGATVFTPQRFVECSGALPASSEPPNANC